MYKPDVFSGFISCNFCNELCCVDNIYDILDVKINFKICYSRSLVATLREEGEGGG